MRRQSLEVIIVSTVVSAIVGAAFGFYAASLLQSPLTPSSIINRIINPTTTIVSNDDVKVIAVARQASPSVVSIVATKDLTYVDQGQYNQFQNFCNDPFFRQFLGDQCNGSSQPPQTHTERRQVAAGTGFIVTRSGYILTNKHVIDIAGADFTVIANDNKRYPARVVVKDPKLDLAVVKIDAAGPLAPLTLGDSSKLQTGQTVIAIGNALGEFSNTVSRGVVSGLSRSITAGVSGGQSEQLNQVIQTDAAINPGNSGGPLLDLNGQVVGINTAIVAGAQNIGFALPINQARQLIQDLPK